MNTEFNINLYYETFFEEVWDYVSEHIVTQEMWNNHEDRFQELTYELFQYYKNTTITLPNGEVQVLVSSKVYARIIESFVKNFKSLFS